MLTMEINANDQSEGINEGINGSEVGEAYSESYCLLQNRLTRDQRYRQISGNIKLDEE